VFFFFFKILFCLFLFFLNFFWKIYKN